MPAVTAWKAVFQGSRTFALSLPADSLWTHDLFFKRSSSSMEFALKARHAPSPI